MTELGTDSGPIVTYNGPRRGRGRNAPKLFVPSMTHHEVLGASRVSSAGLLIVGSWDMLPAVGGVGEQGPVERCFGFSTKKTVGLYQYGQTGNPLEFSADWCYAGCLSEIRRLELGGSPSFEALLANPLTDTGSEPAAGWNFFRRAGFALKKYWAETPGFNPTEVGSAGGEITASAWKSAALGQASIVAPLGPELTQALLAALSPFKDGKRGQSVQLSIASSTQAFDSSDGSRILLSSDLGGANYDHAVVLVGAAPTPVTYECPFGMKFLLANSWGITWGARCEVPELAPTGNPTGNTILFPGCSWISERAAWAATDWSMVGEAA